MENSTINRLYQKEWWKIANKLFGNNKSITKQEFIKIMKENLNPNKKEFNPVKPDSGAIKAFDSEFTWKNIEDAFMNDESVTREVLSSRLKKLFNYFIMEKINNSNKN